MQAFSSDKTLWPVTYDFDKYANVKVETIKELFTKGTLKIVRGGKTRTLIAHVEGKEPLFSMTIDVDKGKVVIKLGSGVSLEQAVGERWEIPYDEFYEKAKKYARWAVYKIADFVDNVFNNIARVRGETILNRVTVLSDANTSYMTVDPKLIAQVNKIIEEEEMPLEKASKVWSEGIRAKSRIYISLPLTAYTSLLALILLMSMESEVETVRITRAKIKKMFYNTLKFSIFTHMLHEVAHFIFEGSDAPLYPIVVKALKDVDLKLPKTQVLNVFQDFYNNEKLVPWAFVLMAKGEEYGDKMTRYNAFLAFYVERVIHLFMPTPYEKKRLSELVLERDEEFLNSMLFTFPFPLKDVIEEPSIIEEVRDYVNANARLFNNYETIMKLLDTVKHEALRKHEIARKMWEKVLVYILSDLFYVINDMSDNILEAQRSFTKTAVYLLKIVVKEEDEGENGGGGVIVEPTPVDPGPHPEDDGGDDFNPGEEPPPIDEPSPDETQDDNDKEDKDPSKDFPGVKVLEELFESVVMRKSRGINFRDVIFKTVTSASLVTKRHVGVPTAVEMGIKLSTLEEAKRIARMLGTSVKEVLKKRFGVLKDEVEGVRLMRTVFMNEAIVDVLVDVSGSMSTEVTKEYLDIIYSILTKAPFTIKRVNVFLWRAEETKEEYEKYGNYVSANRPKKAIERAKGMIERAHGGGTYPKGVFEYLGSMIKANETHVVIVLTDTFWAEDVKLLNVINETMEKVKRGGGKGVIVVTDADSPSASFLPGGVIYEAFRGEVYVRKGEDEFVRVGG